MHRRDAAASGARRSRCGARRGGGGSVRGRRRRTAGCAWLLETPTVRGSVAHSGLSASEPSTRSQPSDPRRNRWPRSSSSWPRARSSAREAWVRSRTGCGGSSSGSASVASPSSASPAAASALGRAITSGGDPPRRSSDGRFAPLAHRGGDLGPRRSAPRRRTRRGACAARRRERRRDRATAPPRRPDGPAKARDPPPAARGGCRPPRSDRSVDSGTADAGVRPLHGQPPPKRRQIRTCAWDSKVVVGLQERFDYSSSKAVNGGTLVIQNPASPPC